MKEIVFPFKKENYILMAMSVALIVIGFILMSGPGTTAEGFQPDIFSTRRIVVAPFVSFTGYLSMIVAILYKKKEKNAEIV